MTFNDILEREIYRDRAFGGYEGTIDPYQRSGTGIFHPQIVHDAVKRAERGRDRPFDYISGHMAFGLHRFLERPAQYVTFLRHPVDRVVSTYNYVRAMGWLSHHEPLTDFLERDFLGSSDAMVRQISGDPTLDVMMEPAYRSDARPVTERDFTVADNNLLDHFCIAAPIGQFDAALFLIARRFGWPLSRLLYTPTNVTTTALPKADVSPKARQMILERNRWDALLFERVSDRFRLACSDAPKAVLADLGTFVGRMRGFRRVVCREGLDDRSRTAIHDVFAAELAKLGGERALEAEQAVRTG